MINIQSLLFTLLPFCKHDQNKPDAEDNYAEELWEQGLLHYARSGKVSIGKSGEEYQDETRKIQDVLDFQGNQLFGAYTLRFGKPDNSALTSATGWSSKLLKPTTAHLSG